jgi:hypothetical protein
MSTPEPNPLEFIAEEAPSVARKVPPTGPQAKDFSALMTQLCMLGVIITLPALLLTLACWPVGIPMLLAGLSLIGTGRGLGAYKVWAWYAAVAILVPLNLGLAALCVAAIYSEGTVVGLTLLIGPIYAGYVLWVLLSPSGRQRYWHNAAAAARVEASRNPTVRKRYRKR